MKLKDRLNLTFLTIFLAILTISFLLIFTTHNLFSSAGSDYEWLPQKLHQSVFALIIIAVLTAGIGMLITRLLMSRIFKLISELNIFTHNLIKGEKEVKMELEGSDELTDLAKNLNKVADEYKEKVDSLENAITKRQRAVRELAILNELMSYITSEFKFENILKNFVDRTKDLIKAGHCAAITFIPESLNTKIYVTNEDIQDPASVRLNPDGFFKELLENMFPMRIMSQKPNKEGNAGERIKIPELNLEVKDLIAVPLISSDKLSGIMLLTDKLEGSFDQEDEDMLMNFAFQAFQTISMHEEITNLAVTDGLTGINNHRHFQERLSEEVEICKRYNRYLSLLILDVDNFKSFNDTHGHQSGDIVLKSIASIMEDQIRKTDFPARYGGEEFAIIMPETNFNGAKILSGRLRERIAKTPFILPNGEKTRVTVSIGFASIPENAREKTELIEMADKALYFAKEHGRNRSYGFEEGYQRGDESEHFDAEPLVIENLAHIVDSRTPYTKGHSVEVAKLAIMIANEIKLEESDIESLRIASILHDIGTIHVPEKLLNKPGELTEEEKKVIKAHPGLAEMVLKKYPLIEEVLPIILYHHERYDGKGYPTGISGDDIPLHARILAIAEAFHAMVSPRPYKDKLTVSEAIEELKAGAGTQFDPQLVESFIKTLKYKNTDSA